MSDENSSSTALLHKQNGAFCEKNGSLSPKLKINKNKDLNSSEGKFQHDLKSTAAFNNSSKLVESDLVDLLNIAPPKHEHSSTNKFNNHPTQNNNINNSNCDNLRRLFIGGLRLGTTKEKVISFYQNFGEVLNVTIMTDPVTKKSRGFGFVTFSKPDGVDNAQKARPHVIDGKSIDCKRAIPKDDPDPENRYLSLKIFVGGLQRNLTIEQLKLYFSKFGNIIDCLLVVNPQTKVSRGFAFLTFNDTDIVDKIIVSRPHFIEGYKADVKKALSKDELAQVRSRQAIQQQNQSFVQTNVGNYFNSNSNAASMRRSGSIYPEYLGNLLTRAVNLGGNSTYSSIPAQISQSFSHNNSQSQKSNALIPAVVGNNKLSDTPQQHLLLNNPYYYQVMPMANWSLYPPRPRTEPNQNVWMGMPGNASAGSLLPPDMENFHSNIFHSSGNSSQNHIQMQRR